MNIKRFAIVGTVLFILLMSVGVMYAQGPDGEDGPAGRGPGGKGGPRGNHGLVEEIAAQTDTAVEDVIAARSEGQSFNDYLAEFDVDPADVISAVVAESEERLVQAVADGDLTQEEADERLADLETRLTEAMASTEPFEARGDGERPDGEGRPNQGQRGNRGFNNIDVISEALGLQPEDVLSAWQDGSTLAEIIEENGGDVEAIKAEIVADSTEKINQAVADEKLTQEEADAKIAELDAHVDELLSGDFEARPAGERPDGEGSRGPRDRNEPPQGDGTEEGAVE